MFDEADKVIGRLRDGSYFGVTADLSNHDYHSLDKYWSSTQLKYLISTSPRHFKAKYIDKCLPPTNVTAAMRLGSACHALLLQPGKFSSDILVMPELNLRTTAGRESRDDLLRDNPHKIVIKEDEYAEASKIVSGVHDNPEAMELLRKSSNEVSLFWKCPYSGLSMKARVDGLIMDDAPRGGDFCLLEYKTTSSAEPDAFSRHCDDMNYELSLYHYWQGIRVCFGADGDFNSFFIVSEDSAPYVSEVYRVPQLMHELGRVKWLSAVDALAAGFREEFWPGYSNRSASFSPPLWALKKWNVNMDFILDETF